MFSARWYWIALELLLALGLLADGEHRAADDEVHALCFTQPNCSFCVQQAPAWGRLKEHSMAGTVVLVDTQRRPEMAKAWKVRTTPTTIWVIADKEGKSVEVSRAARVLSDKELSLQYVAALEKRNAPFVAERERQAAAQPFTPK